MKKRTFFAALAGIVSVSIVYSIWLYPIRNVSTIVCTTNIIGDAVKHIVKDRVPVTVLMHVGIDPHVYRAKESDVHAIASADIIFYNGLHLEGKMGEIFEHMRTCIPTIAVCDALPKSNLIESEFEEVYDPHVWHDVSLWITIVHHIGDCLSAHYPQHADAFKQNTRVYSAQLHELDAYVRNKSNELPAHKRIVVTGHDAFSYFGRSYGFRVVGLQGISTDCQVSGRDMINLTSYIVENNISALFLESSIPSCHIEAIQRAVAARGQTVTIGDELFSDSLGHLGTTASTYHGMITHNIDTIVNALKHECS